MRSGHLTVGSRYGLRSYKKTGTSSWNVTRLRLANGRLPHSSWSRCYRRTHFFLYTNANKRSANRIVLPINLFHTILLRHNMPTAGTVSVELTSTSNTTYFLFPISVSCRIIRNTCRSMVFPTIRSTNQPRPGCTLANLAQMTERER